MNKNATKAVFLGILALVLGFFLYKNFMTESPEERERRERLEATIQARQRGETAAAAEGQATTASAASSTPGAIPEDDKVNIEELAASIKEVDFNYDAARKEERMRNPMAPLVGPYAAQSLPSQTGGGQPGSETEEAAAAAIYRNLRLSGIVWHPTDPVAIINNEAIPKGYVFPAEMFRTARSQSGILDDGVSVERITRNSVILKHKNSEVTLELKER